MKEKITPNFLGLIQQVNFGNLPLLKRCGSTVIYFLHLSNKLRAKIILQY